MQILGEGRFLRLVSVDGWEYVERQKITGIVVIAALTADDEVVLIEQVRPSVRQAVIELPAGLVGDDFADEALETAALRELEEETGYTAAEMEIVAEGPSSAGLASEIITILVARGLTKTGPGGGVPGEEEIVTHLVPRTQVRAWLTERRQQGTLIDPKVYAGLFFL